METNNNWIAVQLAKSNGTTNSSQSSHYATLISGGKQARPGDIFRTPKAILERGKNSGRPVNPFNHGD